jgi:SAM-dependent methyltransferase
MMLVSNLRRAIQTQAVNDGRFKSLVTSVADKIGYDLTHLTRKVYWEDCRQKIEAMNPASLDVLEISAGATWRDIPFRSYRSLDYPEHDICSEPSDPALDGKFDLIIADQVFEHLLWPYRAGRNVYKMLRPGGYFMAMAPFLIRIHEVPYDCSRWTETGMKYFLAECGFDLDAIQTASWGNASALKASLVTWGRVGWRRKLPNDPRFPITVWAVARKAT